MAGGADALWAGARGREGFVLPVVLLVVILIFATGMAMSTVAVQQVRSGGDFRTSVMATHAAEGGASRVVDGFVSGDWAWQADGTWSGEDLQQVSTELPWERPEEANHGDAAWWVESMEFDGDEVTWVVRGEVLQTGTNRGLRVTFERGSGGSSSPFASAVVGCEGVTLSGSGRIDSWDSRQGLYSPGLAAANAHVGTITGQGDIVLSGSSPILGDVISIRDIVVRGSSQVSGDYRAMRDIDFRGNPRCPAGAVEAAGSIRTPGPWWENGCGGVDFEEGADVNYTPPPCDPLDVANLVADTMAAYRPASSDFENWPHGGWRADPVTLSGNRGFRNNVRIGPGADPLVVDAGATDVLFVDGNFDLNSSAHLRFFNPSTAGSPQHVRLLVDGDVSMTGGSILDVDPGVSVTIYTTGRVNFSGGHSQEIRPTVNMGSASEPEFRPTLGVFASTDRNNGVSISGNSPLSAVVYAPRTSVSVSGSGRLYGAVVGETVSVSGNAGIHYDEALGLLGGAAISGGGEPRILRWEAVR
ncbi:MAG: hypothetical protein EA352_09195 [Gemmatimonadales bacterium]|nr:MAG: hypothetical protein EA352_09195 [Gemmatimonadales bacterium]